MTAILLTGMSGAGKSTVLLELAFRGWSTVDTDLPEWIELADERSPWPGERIWRERHMHRLLDAPRASPLAVAGTVRNQGMFSDRFDAIILLSAPLDVMLDRVRRRTTNPFGRSESEQAAIARDHEAVEPMLRAAASHEIATTGSLDDVVAEVERIARV